MRKRNLIPAYDFFSQPEKPLEVVKKKKNPTNDLTNKILNHINTHDQCYGFRVNVTGIYDPRQERYIHSGATLGVSDVLSCVFGTMICFELKRGKDSLRPKQLKFKKAIEDAGGQFHEIRSWEDFELIWKQITRTPF